MASKKFIRGFGYAFKGVMHVISTQLNFQIHLVASLLAIFMGYVLHVSVSEWLWIGLCIAMVLVAELFNTALEILTDLVSPGYNKQAGLVKDIAAAAVLICALFSLFTALVIFIPKLQLLIQHAA